MSTPIRVLLADDHPLICTGIRTVLASTSTIALVGVAVDGQATQQRCLELQPDILLLDLGMPGPPAPATVAFVQDHCPHTHVLVLSAHSDYANAHQMLRTGVAGYVLKDEMPAVLIQAIHAVAQGDTWFSQAIMTHLVRGQRGEQVSAILNTPTERERQVLSGVAQGWTNARIAHELGISERTVRQHLEKVFARLEVDNRTAAVIAAQQQGWLEA